MPVDMQRIPRLQRRDRFLITPHAVCGLPGVFRNVVADAPVLHPVRHGKRGPHRGER